MGDSISLFLLPLPSNLASLSVYDLRTTGKKKKKMGFGKYFLGICLMGLTLIDVSLAAGGLNSPKDYVDIHNEARKNVVRWSIQMVRTERISAEVMTTPMG